MIYSYDMPINNELRVMIGDLTAAGVRVMPSLAGL